MGETAAEIFTAIAIVPVVGAIMLALYGLEHQWLLDATPMIVIIALVAGIGGALLSSL